MSERHPIHLWPGAPLALGAAVLFGIATPFSKLLLGTVDPQMLAGLLYLGAGMGLAGVHFGRDALGVPAPEAALKPADWPWLAAVVLFGGMLGPLFLMLGVARTDASSASLLLNLEGLATMAIAWIVFRENVDRRLLLGALAILAGAAALSWRGGDLSVGGGSIFIAAACLAWGLDNNLTRKLSAADPVVTAMTKGLAAGAVNTVIALIQGTRLPASTTLLAAGLLGFFAIGVSLVLFIRALRHLGAARTGAYFSLAPFIGAVVAILVLREPMTETLLVAGILMGFGLWLHLAERHEHDHLHEAVDHDHSHRHDDGHHDHRHDGPVAEPHSHRHRHRRVWHSHIHYPDLHHRHSHD
ncbi:MAG TPA: DMT family transporter [Alphaproteobacteria bacterium]|jgi:drug/metabolite transporter (DMT)-like permease|nr:DMT family transporter [Alphaproteobacteria bacterium]